MFACLLFALGLAEPPRPQSDTPSTEQVLASVREADARYRNASFVYETTFVTRAAGPGRIGENRRVSREQLHWDSTGRYLHRVESIMPPPEGTDEVYSETRFDGEILLMTSWHPRQNRVGRLVTVEPASGYLPVIIGDAEHPMARDLDSLITPVSTRRALSEDQVAALENNTATVRRNPDGTVTVVWTPPEEHLVREELTLDPAKDWRLVRAAAFDADDMLRRESVHEFRRQADGPWIPRKMSTRLYATIRGQQVAVFDHAINVFLGRVNDPLFEADRFAPRVAAGSQVSDVRYGVTYAVGDEPLDAEGIEQAAADAID